MHKESYCTLPSSETNKLLKAPSEIRHFGQKSTSPLETSWTDLFNARERFFANAGALLRALAHDLFGYHHA